MQGGPRYSARSGARAPQDPARPGHGGVRRADEADPRRLPRPLARLIRQPGLWADPRQRALDAGQARATRTRPLPASEALAAGGAGDDRPHVRAGRAGALPPDSPACSALPLASPPAGGRLEPPHAQPSRRSQTPAAHRRRGEHRQAARAPSVHPPGAPALPRSRPWHQVGGSLAADGDDGMPPR